MRRFQRDPEASIHPRNPLLGDLIYGWGNEWSALEEYLVGCLQLALSSSKPSLECGSGLTTILVGVVAQQRGYVHWALEHAPAWASRVQRCLDRYRIGSTVLCTKPLKDYGDFLWYDPPLESMPESFTLIICDGPPGSTRGGRYGLVPVMRRWLKPGSVILLDDAGRKEERTIARRWVDELGCSIEMIGRAKPYIKMTVSDRGGADGGPGAATRWTGGSVTLRRSQ